MSSKASRWKTYRPVIALSILSMLVCGLAYPLLITGVSQAAFPYQANGSQVQLGGRAVGSYYIDNGFTLPIFFHGRNETNPFTASASGVDPDITLSDALSQIPRISNATGIPASSLDALVVAHEHWTLWITGDPYVNVLELNLALIAAYPSSYPGYA
ncbi:MAG: potassium-transporting ATPase subunit C [Nitrososphaerota archaeon]|jgi:K+-transporting ATPase ATPase C chain|nr:potassium-transporting ATPase subunit C [Nitrososphaerota archaeon]MDG6913147.1 potassium-transporting ATPase subunit C [Nitrososphaerota archaeon]MDG6937299.1 potassium-transporting ATPase subunit C [Nitrososphaerota archaeon]MDG6961341.1 potassium-transporting ATPase subunit C [Nitrososphaerota archaeon]MDG6962841.1 potassium-transporting ATPase subunit C [Nitrososphaerota archaeon]